VVGFLPIPKGKKARPPVNVSPRAVRCAASCTTIPRARARAATICVASSTLATQVDLLKPVPQ
jgi:hypothetical protein